MLNSMFVVHLISICILRQTMMPCLSPFLFIFSSTKPIHPSQQLCVDQLWR
ncbi:hypothetical protein HanRHA438_Chr16g0776631 [Helianthus annuus]|nr:hypothetical protein HanRHA438_Chr16g0776631 [Helianthus annuus]